MDARGPENQLYSASSTNQDDFLDASDVQSPEYDNVINQNSEPVDPETKARQDEEMKQELEKLEDEIMTLRQVLSVKVRQSSDLKRKLGITPMVEFRHDLKQGIQNIKESDAFQKTNEKFSAVGDKISSSDAYMKTTAGLKNVGAKTTSAFSTIGSFTKTKLGDMRNSNTFKSFEEKIGGAYSNVKTKVRGSKSEQNFEDVLNSTVNEREEVPITAASAPTTPGDAPGEKVPL